MSFSTTAKDELARKTAESDCCAVAELSAFAHVTGRIDLKGGGAGDFLYEHRACTDGTVYVDAD